MITRVKGAASGVVVVLKQVTDVAEGTFVSVCVRQACRKGIKSARRGKLVVMV